MLRLTEDCESTWSIDPLRSLFEIKPANMFCPFQISLPEGQDIYVPGLVDPHPQCWENHGKSSQNPAPFGSTKIWMRDCSAWMENGWKWWIGFPRIIEQLFWKVMVMGDDHVMTFIFWPSRPNDWSSLYDCGMITGELSRTLNRKSWDRCLRMPSNTLYLYFIFIYIYIYIIRIFHMDWRNLMGNNVHNGMRMTRMTMMTMTMTMTERDMKL